MLYYTVALSMNELKKKSNFAHVAQTHFRLFCQQNAAPSSGTYSDEWMMNGEYSHVQGSLESFLAQDIWRCVPPQLKQT